MTPEQLTLDGGAVPYPIPPPRRLTERQRYLLAYMRARSNPTMPTYLARPFYVDPYGALRRLERMGLVQRVARGKWTA